MCPPSVIIHNFHVVGVSVAPHKTDTPLVVDADAVLSRAVMFQLMKPVTRRHSQIHQALGRVKHQKLSPSWLPDVRESADILIMKKPLRVRGLEGLNHIQRI
jgi:hypothetical protein